MKPNGVITGYQLQCSAGGRVIKQLVVGSLTKATLTGLLPYTSYICSITAHTSVGGGPAANTSVITEEGGKCLDLHHSSEQAVLFATAPKQVTHLRTVPIANSNTSLIVTWQPPTQPNGIIIGYELNVSTPRFKVFDYVGIPALPVVNLTVKELCK